MNVAEQVAELVMAVCTGHDENAAGRPHQDIDGLVAVDLIFLIDQDPTAVATALLVVAAVAIDGIAERTQRPRAAIARGVLDEALRRLDPGVRP